MVISSDKTKSIVLAELKRNSELSKLCQATVSHDMRAPCNAIEIMTENIIKKRGMKK
jgi:hypothetical protein